MSMDSRMRPATPRQYEEFDPKTSWQSEEGAEILLVHLPGFKKEQLRVQLSPSRQVKIIGERPLGGNRWQRFVKEAQVPAGCDAKEISAKFEEGVLYVRQPKLITPAEPPIEVPKPQPVQPPPQQQPMPAPAPAPAPAKKEYAGDDENMQEDANKGKELEKGESRRAEPEAETGNEYEEENRDKEELGRKTAAASRRFGGGIFKEVKKPENFKMLAVIVVVAIALAVHTAYVNKVCRRYVTDEL